MIGDTIKKTRLEKGLTQKVLGELSGIAEPTIRKYESGRLNPKIETVKKIANALGVSVDLFYIDWRDILSPEARIHEVEDAVERMSYLFYSNLQPEQVLDLADLIETLDIDDFKDVLEYGQYKMHRRKKADDDQADKNKI